MHFPTPSSFSSTNLLIYVWAWSGNTPWITFWPTVYHSFKTTPQKKHSLIPPVQRGKGKWVLCMKKYKWLLNRDTPVPSLDPPGLNIIKLRNKKAVCTPKIVNLNERQMGTDERTQGNEAVSQHDRQWTQPVRLFFNMFVTSFSCFSLACLHFIRWISLWTSDLNRVLHYFRILSFFLTLRDLWLAGSQQS